MATSSNAAAGPPAVWAAIFVDKDGKSTPYILRFTLEDSPKMVMEGFRQAYGTILSKTERFNHLFHVDRPVVDVAEISIIEDPTLNPFGTPTIQIHSHRRDDTLTRALRKPHSVSNIDSAAFFARYEHLGVGSGDPAPRYALIVSQEEHGGTAATIARGTMLFLTLAIQIGLHFVPC